MKNNAHDHAFDHLSDHDSGHANESTHRLKTAQNQGEKHPVENHPNNNSTNYKFAFFLILLFAIIELFGGIFTHSLALLSDAWHMFSDVFALGLAWLASYLSAKPGTPNHANQKSHANGQSHAEIAAAAVNAMLMLVVVTYIVYEALQRFDNPHPVISGYVMLIAFAGLVVNIIVAKMLHSNKDGRDHAHDHNKHAAYLHVMGDILGSVAALAAGIVIYFTGWLKIDPLLSIFISLLILIVTLNLIREVWQTYHYS